MEKTKTKELTDLLNELGIQKSDSYALIIYNDEINSMQWVVICLYEVCGLNEEESIKIMFEAHNNGKATVKVGEYDELVNMKKTLNERNINADVVEN